MSGLPPIQPSGIGTALLYPVQTSAGPGISPFLSAKPGNTNPPIIFEPPPPLTQSMLSLWIIATGRSPNWGGCQVWSSVDPGGTGGYGQIGDIFDGAVQGVTTGDLPSAGDPDTADTLTVDTSESLSQVLPGSTTDADLYVTLCYLATAAGGYELVSYAGAQMIGRYSYGLTYLRRGIYGTAIADHPTGSAFARLLGNTFRIVYPPNLVGTTVWLKFPAANMVGAQLQTLADVEPYSYTLLGTGLPGGGLNSWFQSWSVGGKFSDLVLDEWDSNYELFDVVMPVPVTFPTGFAGSLGGCETAPGGDVTLTLQQIHAGTPTTIGTITIASATTIAAFNLAAGLTIPAGDRLRLYAPAAVDTTLTGLFGTIVGSR